jgi:hypothetical protein
VAKCPKCGQKHAPTRGGRPCVGHVKKRDGAPCNRTAMDGQNVCASHGGRNPAAKAAGRRRVAEAKAERILSQALADAYGDDVPDVPPAEAMLRAVSWTYAEVTVLRRKVAELGENERVWGITRETSGGEDHGTIEEARPNIWWSMLRESMRDLVKFAAAARAAGCDEARVKLAQQQGTMLADVIRAILGDLALTSEQQALVSEVVPRHLRAVAG